MKEIKIQSVIRMYAMDELDETGMMLVNKAMEATNNSYAKYSNFHVGAALMLENGRVVIGANQENAAYPVTLCAERTAIFAAQANYPDQPVKALAIAARNANGFLEDPISPCGSCRQVILEVEERYGKPIKIYLYGTKGIFVVDSIKDLLPLSFVEDCLY